MLLPPSPSFFYLSASFAFFLFSLLFLPLFLLHFCVTSPSETILNLWLLSKSYEESMCPRNVSLSERTLRNVFITRPSSFFGKMEKKALKTVKCALGDRDEASRQEQEKSGAPSKRRRHSAVKVPCRWERDDRCLSYEDSFLRMRRGNFQCFFW